MKKKSDLEKRYEAYQKTIDFHMMEIQGLFKGCKATLIIRDSKKDDLVCIYSNDDVRLALLSALKKLTENKSKKGKKG